MIAREFFQKWKHYSFMYALYSTLYWLGYYCRPLNKLCMWAFHKKSDYINTYLKSRYGDIIEQYSKAKECSVPLSKDEEYPIWVFWYQGFDSAPELVKACYRNLVAKNGRAVHMVNSENVHQYVEIPDYIDRKREAGVISLTHYSDIVRVSLLAKYGGMWLDSTCWCSEPIPQWVKEQPFFSCKTIVTTPLPLWSNSRWTSWLLGTSQVNSNLFCFIRDLFYRYAKQENYWIDYLLLDALIYLASIDIPIPKIVISELPENNLERNTLHFLLNKEYDDAKFKKITQNTWLFKLTYKQNFSLFTSNGKPTLYNHLINDKL